MVSKSFWHEIIFVSLIGIFGFIASMKSVIIGLNMLNPIAGFFVYYLIWYILIFILSLTGFAVLGKKISNPFQIIGTMLILFAVSIIVDWTSGYTAYVINGNFADNMQIFLASEDGFVWYIWHDLIGVGSIFWSRILTYSITPMFSAIIGALMVRRIDFELW
jgi:hypothetical protein